MNDPQQPYNPTSPGAPQPANPGPPSWLSLAMEVGIAVVALGFVAFKNPGLLRSGAVFLLTLSVLVFVHEWGHYQFARWAGMKVNRFAIGFPPWIYTRRVNDIDYSIGALPIGGMVDIAGLGSEEEMVATGKGETVENATREARPDAPFGEKQFQDASLGWRFWTLFAGPLMNFIFAIVVFIGIYSIVGYPMPLFKPTISAVIKDNPAEKAGIQAGDTIVKIDEKTIANNEDVSKAIRGGTGKRVHITVARKGKDFSFDVTPVLKDLDGHGTKVPSIGIGFNPTDSDSISSFSYIKMSPLEAVESGFLKSADISYSILDMIKRAVTRKLSSDEVKGIGGPVKIAQTVGQMAQLGPIPALNWAAMLSVNLGLMNLLPFPALDGGRILFLLYEKIMRRPIDPRKEGLVHAVGIVMLLAFMLLITIHDVLPMIRGKI